MYADVAFYTNEYQGTVVADAQLVKLLNRASRDIDALTGFCFDFETLPDKSKRLVRFAVCSQAEFLSMNGETASDVSSGGGSFTIGSYSESGASKGSNSNTKPVRHSASVVDYLFPTGLLYTGVGRIG